MINENLIQYNIKGVFLDWDGTLIDDLFALKKAYFLFLNNFKKEGSEEEFDKFLNGMTIPEAVIFLKEKYHLPHSEKKLLKDYEQKITRVMDSCKPFKSSEKVLQKLKDMNLSIGLVTSSKKKYMWGVLEKLKWKDYFNFYVFGDEVQKAKPNPDLYLLALKKAGLKNIESLAVEDSINGILSAKNAGITSIGISKDIKCIHNLYKNGAQVVISDLSELISLIKNEQ